MKIENTILELRSRYIEDDDRYSSKTEDILEISIPLPGGTAKYELVLPKGVKESLEFAASLATKGK